MATTGEIARFAAEIVSAYVTRNRVAPEAVPALIDAVSTSLATATSPKMVAVPAVPIEESLRSDAVICLECGQRYSTIRRHLFAAHRLTDIAYRQKWNLPMSYPMVAPNYSTIRSRLAKEIGLGLIADDPKRLSAK